MHKVQIISKREILMAILSLLSRRSTNDNAINFKLEIQMKNMKLSVALLLLIPQLSYAQCFTMSGSFIERKDDGELCFPGAPEDVGYHQYVDVRVLLKGQAPKTFQFYGEGEGSTRSCSHTREGNLCHNVFQRKFGLDLGFGRTAKIILEEGRGEAELPGLGLYNLLP
jgi:hypothetical protein